MKYWFQLLALSSFLFLLSFGTAKSQHSTGSNNIDLFQKIDDSFHQGDITLDERVLLKFFPSRAKQKLTGNTKTDFDQPIKCGTPAYSDFHRHRQELAPSTVQQIESELERSSLQASETYQSPDGYFSIHYETSGSHAVPAGDSNNNGVPDYVEEVAAAADSSYRHEVQQIGYTDPIPAGQTYDIEIVNLEVFYGQTVAPGNDETYIQIENDFAEGFPPNDDPEGNQVGAIKVTVAHEFKHAIQYEANDWQGETGLWLEMDATLMEEVVYDDVNDYYNYINSENSIFNNPDGGFYPGSYADITWALFFEEKYGSQFWVDVWQTIKNNSFIAMTDAIATELGGAANFHSNYIESQLWHYASGNNAVQSFGFEESSNYPSPAISQTYSGDTELPQPDTLNTLSAKYIDVTPSPFPGSIAFALTELMPPNAGLGVLVYFDDGGTTPFFLYEDQQNMISEETDIQWDEVEKLGLVITNGSYQEQSQYAWAVRSVDPQVVSVEQNYPNPFREQTNIRYSLTQQSEVRLEVYDVLGRKIATLVNASQARGIYTEQFDARNYASGLYFYRLIIDGNVTTKKMTLIK